MVVEISQVSFQLELLPNPPPNTVTLPHHPPPPRQGGPSNPSPYVLSPTAHTPLHSLVVYAPI
ncbi:hypothetical protein P691DRAFT_808316 [Macrolepiota fuliginosa MF-IS2]|uniref:Uncharacterized protein n=1 Tax=Macrolepiota fuliginosa MF-IS2 TaxID=1400762 RepID=A0A9P6BXA4_9AGAR|nr:hypothetical protein P691DRAFT_808316 [Macrolepiota fuliginosa MF-IS2]